MTDKKEKYLDHLKKVLRESYLILKRTKKFPQDKALFLEGYMTAGRMFDVNSEEMQTVINETNIEVFGMDLETRRKKYKKENAISVDDTRYYDIPTWIRKGIRFWNCHTSFKYTED